MSKRPKLEVKLISLGQIIPQLHYGVYFRDWWTIREDYNEETLLFPIRVGWQTTFIQNDRKFYVHITEGNELNEKQPGFRCNPGSKFSDIKETSSAAITSLYNRLFSNSNTRFFGPYILGWDNKDLLDASLEGVEFRPFAFKVGKYLIQIINIGIESNSDLMDPILILGTSPNDVWEKTGLFKKFHRTQLFGLENSLTQKKIATQKIPKCTPVLWNNEAITNNIFNYHLKKRTIANINWRQLFQIWLNQPSTIIELRGMLQPLYPYNHTFNERELHAWHAFLKAMGCVKITPYSKDQSEELNQRGIQYNEKQVKSELVTILRSNIQSETQNRIEEAQQAANKSNSIEPSSDKENQQEIRCALAYARGISIDWMLLDL
ncbi:2372_t:CDS:2 [Gigaspora rosea]|nr:2372_t:CDS:2 [Gigaspora rosea]